MSAVDWTTFGLGAGFGLVIGAVFFAGLAYGMRFALRQARPLPVLLLSAAVRIAMLLAVGWWVAAQGAVALAGFALAFLVLRIGVSAFVRLSPPKAITPWN
jgi:hypothetical protein